MRNPLLSKKLKLSKTRLLIIDDNQLRYNQILQIFAANQHQIHATLLDDLESFKKQLNVGWDIVIFGRAYDLKVEQVFSLIQASDQPELPVLLFSPENYTSQQYLFYIQKGIYDIIDLHNEQAVYISLARALSYSRLQQHEQYLLQELDAIHSHVQSQVKESNKAVAILQEGVHIKANVEYLTLFGLQDEVDIVGLPILDILQPTNVTLFKQKFKRISQGLFDQARFDMESKNPLIARQNPIKIEFVPIDQEDTIQLTIDCEDRTSDVLPIQSVPVNTEKFSPFTQIFKAINRQLQHQRAEANALVLLSLADCPEEVFSHDLKTIKHYFSSISDFIQEQVDSNAFKINPAFYVVLFQAESEEILQSRLMSLKPLEKPQLLEIDQYSLPLHLHLGYVALNQTEILDETGFEELLEQAFSHRLTQMLSDSTMPNFESNPVLQTEAPVAPTLPLQNPLLKALQQKLEAGDIHLKFQQLYDKNDLNLYTYEVTSGFIYEKTWYDLNQLSDLDQAPELSIKVDRWILVEACKQLHNFLTQYPSAKLIINLNHHILWLDQQLPEVLTKLLAIVGSQQPSPIVVQFSEQAIQQNLSLAQQKLAQLKANHIEIAVRNFGQSEASEALLHRVQLDYISLHAELCQMLASEPAMTQLQQRFEVFQNIQMSNFLVKELNDMTLFANAWNIEARYLQGNYFQKKMDRLTDVQDQ